ncbi:glycosyl hydrolase family 88 [Bacillus sp. SA1-12]|uniref:glycoside hydrolase family 88/105 protein n=1 Tax=Bacillus sp. SA1-12 TaxID=1455638 RepID=UPI00062741F2|nr:glycoside hydrolase family 88 protein [Bacillus sp. SA1-12]KKI89037.1 glycosyl hydrolase family 88 [Bacillus sp. SA1-12]
MKEDVCKAVRKITNQLLHLKRPNNEESLKKAEDGARIGYFPRDFGMEEWDWPQGVGLYGLRNLAENDEFPSYDVFSKNWAEEQIRRGLPLKNINTTAPMLTLMDLEDMEELALQWMNWIYHHSPRTKENGLQHVTSGDTKDELTLNEGQIWIDTLFMVVLFMGKMGIEYKQADWKKEAAYQFLLHIRYLFNQEESLFYHGWDFENQHHFSGAFWCRGNSWFTLAVPEFINMMKNNLEEETYISIVSTYKAQVKRLVELQSENGLWHTLLDDSDSYTEVSGSAAITAGILKGIRYGLLDSDYLNACRKSIYAVLKNISEDGTVLNVSAGTAIGKEKEDYKKIIIAPTAYGQALAIVLLSEVLQHEVLLSHIQL